MKLEKKKIEKIILGIIIAVIFIIVLFFLILGPSIRHISSLHKDIRSEKIKVTDAQRELENLARTKSNLQNLKTKISEYESSLPEATPYWLIGKLNQLAENTGISFDKTERKGYSLQVGEYNLQEFDIELRTGYHKLGEFINQLEASSPFIVIRSLNIAGNPENIKRHEVKLTVGAFVIAPDPQEEKK